MTETNRIDVLGNGAVFKTQLVAPNTDQAPKPGEKVIVHYTGTLENGKKFDSSRDRDEPFTFTLEKGEVIRGWDVAVSTMKIGEKATFWIRSDYAYGDAGAGKDIPGKSNLNFEIELLEIDQGEFPRRILQEGTGDVCPIEGADVVISYKLSCDGKEIEKKENHKFMLNDGTMIDGIHKILEEMRKGEILEAKISSKYAFGDAGHPELGVPPKSKPLDLWIHLIDFEELKFNYEMTKEEVFAFVNKQKNKGTEFVKEKKYKLAIIQYDRAIVYFRNDGNFNDEDKMNRKMIERDCYLNIALCNLQLKNWKAAIKACDDSLKIEKTIKGLYRKAQAISNQGDHEEAKKLLKEALEMDPNNVDVIKAIEKADFEIRAQNERDRKKFANLFL